MAKKEKLTGYLRVKLAIAFGLLLGVLLLAQSVITYRYVSRNLIRQEAHNEADRKTQSLNRTLRTASSRDSATLTPVIDELIKEAPETIAWMRVFGGDGQLIASGGTLAAAPNRTIDTLRAAAGGPGSNPDDIRSTPAGDVLISISPLGFGGRGRGGPGGPDRGGPGGPGADRGGPPPDFGGPGGRGPSGDFGRGRGRGGNGPWLETAIYLDGVSVNFAPLLLQLGIGCSAAIALLGAVVLIGLRFPHYIRGKQIEEELALARRVQSDLFPAENAPTGNVEFAARFVPARHVGGDLYDVFETNDGGVAMVLGDVSGKGLSAALLMGVVQGAVRTSSDSGLESTHESAADRLNQLVCDKTARERFVSLFWCYLNRESTKLSYINAGHLPPLLVRSRFGRPDFWRLEQGGGPVLGVLPIARYRRAEIDIEPGDILVVFSDGISEAANAAGDEFGDDRIAECVKQNFTRPATEICDAILSDISGFLGAEKPHDDQTLMVVRLAATR